MLRRQHQLLLLHRPPLLASRAAPALAPATLAPRGARGKSSSSSSSALAATSAVAPLCSSREGLRRSHHLALSLSLPLSLAAALAGQDFSSNSDGGDLVFVC